MIKLFKLVFILFAFGLSQNYSLDFDEDLDGIPWGSNHGDYVNFVDSGDSDFDVTEVTIQVWIYSTTDDFTWNYGMIVNKEAAWEIAVWNGGNLVGAASPGCWGRQGWGTGGPAIPLNTWTHVAAGLSDCISTQQDRL